MVIEKTELLKQEIIEYQKEAKRRRDRNYLIRQGHIEGRVETFFDKSGDMLEKYVKTLLPSMIKLPRNHPSGFDYKFFDSFFEIEPQDSLERLRQRRFKLQSWQRAVRD